MCRLLTDVVKSVYSILKRKNKPKQNSTIVMNVELKKKLYDLAVGFFSEGSNWHCHEYLYFKYEMQFEI